jgi:tetratricopeptide (TPR) repeat protein
MSARMAPAILLVLLGVCGALPGTAPAGESAKQLSAQALEQCELGRLASERAARLALFEKGQALAERAVELDEKSAEAHFALFCSLGEQLRIDGENVASIWGGRRALRELDRTLELAPDHLDALSSKGTLLVRLPGLLGGDAEKGELMLRNVVKRDPTAVNARVTLAKIYAARGHRTEAVALATEALEIARAQRRTDLIPDAQATLIELGAAHSVSRSVNP